MRSLSIAPYDYLNVGVLAATGLAQLSNISSSGRGGGSTSSASGGSSQPEAQPTTEPTTELTVSDTEAGGGSRDLVIRFESDDTETARYISGILETATVSGDIG